tara:strand:- start:4076 stop:5260 length:1185 start_codon:yes stop_codon:yes gene_type:complete
MKQKIAILGSTGSIGKNLLEIIRKDKKNFELVLLTANKNYSDLLKQAKEFKVKNIIIKNKQSFQILKRKVKRNEIKIYNDFKSINKILKKKIDYTMSSIIGLDGLFPTLQIIKFTKRIAIANKESIICAWDLLKKELKKNKTKFIPVDSEHFSIWYSLKNKSNLGIKKIYLTASGGPLNRLPKKKFKNIKISQALKHPNWKMGKKISIDSATLMNKVFEVIEAKNIFNLDINNLDILIHPKSYVHAIICYKNGMIELIAHETNMKIPIFNTLYENEDKQIKCKKLNITKLNNLSLEKVNKKKFPLINILKHIPKNNTLFETLIVSVNDSLVNLFLTKKIKFNDIEIKLTKLLLDKNFRYLKRVRPKNIQQIINLNKQVKFQINTKNYINTNVKK